MSCQDNNFRFSLILLIIFISLAYAGATTFSWQVIGKGNESVSGTKATCSNLVSEQCVWNCDDECAACIASGECNRREIAGDCGTSGTEDICRCWRDYESECAVGYTPLCSSCDTKTGASSCTTPIERFGYSILKSASIGDSSVDLGNFVITPMAQAMGIISNITYTAYDTSERARTYFSDTLAETTANPNANAYAQPANGSNLCSRTRTTQSDFDFAIKANVDTASTPGSVILGDVNPAPPATVYTRNSKDNEEIIAGVSNADLRFAFCNGTDARVLWLDTGTGSSRGAGVSEERVTAAQRSPNNNGCYAWEDPSNIGDEECTVMCKSSVQSLSFSKWRFDEGSGSTASNSGNSCGGSGSLVGSPTWVAGARGTSIELYDNKYVDFGAFSVHQNATDSFFVDVWIYPTTLVKDYSTGDPEGHIAGRTEYYVNRSGDWMLRIVGNNQLQFAVRNSSNTGWYWGAQGGSISQINRWYHVRAEWVSGTTYLYQDGVLVGIQSNTDFGSDASNTNKIFAGYRPGSYDNQKWFRGRIDELYIGNSSPDSSGIITMDFDTGGQTAFSQLGWSGSSAPDGDIKMRLKTADTVDGLNSAAWSNSFTNSPTTLNALSGRYARVEATLETTNIDYSPVLNDITLSCSYTNQFPTAIFTINPASAFTNQSVSFDASASSDPDGTISSYSWNFGDTATSSGITATHSYSAAGTYDITLTITDNGGATVSATKAIATTSNSPPTASFTASKYSATTGESITFTSTSTDADGTISSYDWDWGDLSAHGNTAIATHLYSAPGVYTVTLTITDNGGATASATATIVIASATCSNGEIEIGETCDGLNFGGLNCYPDFDNFTGGNLSCNAACLIDTSGCTGGTGTGTCGNGTINAGETCDGVNFGGKTCLTFGFTGGGNLSCNVGCDIDTSNCIANQPPVALFTPSRTSTVANEIISFDASASSDSDGTIASYSWNFGDSQTATGITTMHFYSAAGTYTVALTVADDDGATNSTSAAISIAGLSVGACPAGKTWTSQSDWDLGIKTQVDTASAPGAVKITSGQTAGTINLYFDAGQQSSFSSLSWTAEKPTNTNVKIRIRAANSIAALDSATWTQYYTTSPASPTSQIGRYMQIEALLETTNITVTPTLNDLTLGCALLPTGTGDLIVQTLTFSPSSSVTQGTSVNITATIKNNSSTAISSPFTVALYQGLAVGTPLQTQSVASLAANATSALTFSNISTASLLGSIIFTAFADSANATAEADETNNQQQAVLTVTTVTDAPDIAILSAVFNPAAVSKSQNSQLSVAIKNNGTRATGSFYVALSKAGQTIQMQTISDLASGASTTLAFNVSSTETGAITYTILADSSNVVNESSETNNSASAALTVSTSRPDLSLASFIANNLQPFPGAIVKLTATIKNLGIALVQQAFNALLTSAAQAVETKTISATKTCTNETGQLVSAALCSAANAGDTETMEFSVNTAGKSGSVEYSIYADSGNAVDEDNENNNAGTLTLNITNKPDLRIKTLNYPTSIVKGNSAKVTVVVENIGAVPSGTSNLRAYRTSLGNEITVTNITVPALGATGTYTADFTLSTAELDGLVEVFVAADSANAVDESDEINNSAKIAIVIRSGEICNNAIDDDGDALVDAEDPECTEICGDGIDNDADGRIDEGCGEICWNSIDDDRDGAIDEGCIDVWKEKCGDEIDNDQDGLVDEGCPFIFTECTDTDNDTICNEDEILKFHTDPENPDSDNDCVNDGQEVKYDLTEPLDANSNMIFLDITKEVAIGEKAEIKAKHPMLGTIKNTSAEITWQHKKVVEASDAEGIIRYEPLEVATYDVKVQVCINKIKGQFAAIAAGATMQQFLTNIAKLLFGQTIVEAPLLLILLVVLCGISAVLAYRYSNYLFEKGAKSSEEIRRERLARAALSIIAFVLPLAINRFLSFNAAIVLAIAEIFLIIMFAYFEGQRSDLGE